MTNTTYCAICTVNYIIRFKRFGVLDNVSAFPFDNFFGQAEETAEKTKCSHPATDTATAHTGNCTREQV